MKSPNHIFNEKNFTKSLAETCLRAGLKTTLRRFSALRDMNFGARKKRRRKKLCRNWRKHQSVTMVIAVMMPHTKDQCQFYHDNFFYLYRKGIFYLSDISGGCPSQDGGHSFSQYNKSARGLLARSKNSASCWDLSDCMLSRIPLSKKIIHNIVFIIPVSPTCHGRHLENCPGGVGLWCIPLCRLYKYVLPQRV